MTITKDFQQGLLTALLKDAEFFRMAVSNMKLSDWDMPQIRLVFEIAKRYFEEYEVMIPPDILKQEILIASDGDGKYKTPVSQEDSALAYLNEIYKDACVALRSPSTELTAYYRKLLPEFCAEMRQGTINSRLDLSAQEKAAEIAKIAEETSTMGAENIKFGTVDDIIFEDDPTSTRVGTGVLGLDKRTNWGLKPGEIAVLAGGSGVGKSVTLINFAIANALKGIRSLVITLENPDQMYYQRMLSIFGHFSPSYFMRGKPSTWPEDVRKRLEYVLKNLPARKLIRVLDYSSKTTGCNDIEAAIAQWKKSVKDEVGSDESCKVVYVDYLKPISPRGLAGLGPNPSPDVILPAICQRFGVIAKKQNVVIWTAQQIKSESKRKEVLGQDDVAFASHIVDWLDLGIGIAFVKDELSNDDDNGLDVDDDNEDLTVDERGRKMMISVWKARSSDAIDLVVPLYRGPTLKMWSSQNYAEKVDAAVEAGQLEDLYRMMSPRKGPNGSNQGN